MESKTKKHVLSIDIGYGNTKLVCGHDAGSWSEMCFKSVAPVVLANPAGLAGSLSTALDRISIEIGNAAYLVGPEACISGGGAILGQDFMFRPEYLALLRGALYYSMKHSGGMHPHIDVLVLGLPVSNWRRCQAELIPLGGGPHRIPVPIELRSQFGETLEVSVGKVVVLPQPMGALNDALHGASQSGELDENAIHMVIDPGFNTFDWFVSIGLRPDLQRCGSLQGGVSQLLKVVSNAAGARLGVGSLNLNAVEKGLKTGVMSVHGQRLDMDQFQPMMELAAEAVVDRFVNAIDLSLGIDTIHLAGGGAGFYAKPIRKAFAGYKINFDTASVMANARGFYRVGEAVARMM